LGQRGLARPVLAKQSKDLAGANLQVDLRQSRERTETLRHARKANERRGPAHGLKHSTVAGRGLLVDGYAEQTGKDLAFALTDEFDDFRRQGLFEAVQRSQASAALGHHREVLEVLRG